MNFVKNCWYLGAEAKEIAPGKTLARTLLNERIAFYRTEDGSMHAVEDRCPHRYVPLSLGRVKGDVLECGYHGACFNGEGKCTSIPGQDYIPAKAVIKGYPVIEKYNFVWVWMGDPALADDTSSIPDIFHIHDSDEWDANIALMESFPAYYELLNDNFFDLTHAQFVHPETLGGGGLSDVFRAAKAGDVGAVDDTEEGCVFQVMDDKIITEIRILDAQLSPFFHQLMGKFKFGKDNYEGNLDWILSIEWHAPCVTVFKPFIKPAGAPKEEGFYVSWQTNVVTPETESSCHYFYSVSQNLALGNEQMNKKLFDDFSFAVSQDKVILEGQTQCLSSYDFSPEEMRDRVSFPGDQVTGSCRRVIKKLIDKEQQLSKTAEIATG